MLDSALLERSRQLILEEIGPCWDLTLLHGPGNLGDRLILAGTQRLLSGHHYRDLACDQLADARGETCLLLGSGAFTRAYHEWAPWALRIAQRRFERVIVLPSTFDVSVPPVRDALERTRAVVFAREPRSLAAISEICDSRLALDGAFFFDYQPYMAPGSGVLDAFRTDAEAPPDWQPPPGNRDISLTLSTLDQWLAEIARHATVRTNRAHVMIAAAMLGKTVEVGPCEQFKVDAIAEWALGGLPVRIQSAAAQADLAAEPNQPRAVLPTDEHAPRAPRSVVVPSTCARRPSRVTAVITTRDRPRLALRALRSACAHPQTSAILVDDGSSPAAAAMLRGALDAEGRTRWLATTHSNGAAGARAYGLKHVDSEFVLLLDSDAELQEGALDALLAELEEHPSALVATACVTLPDGRIQHCGGEIRERDGVLDFTLGALAGRPQQAADAAEAHWCEWAAHTAILARTQAFVDFPLDGGMRCYFEDNEWSFRVATCRPRAFRAVPAARVLHNRMPDRHRPGAGPPRDFAQRCGELAGLADIALFHSHHGLVLFHLFSIFDRLRLPDGTPDVQGARLMLALIGALEPAALLDHWCAGTLEPLIDSSWRRHSLALAAQLAEQDRQARAFAEGAAAHARDLEREVRRALEGMAATSARLEEMRATRVWRLARSYWDLRDAVRQRLRASRKR